MTSTSLAGKVILITGASRGIGAGLAQDLHSQGAKLALCARSEIPLHGSPDVITAQFDISDRQAMFEFLQRTTEQFGAIDLMVNNAGMLEPVIALRDLDADDLRRHFEVNVFGVLYGSQAYAQHVRGRDGGGVLINISSGAAWGGYAGWGAYCMGKAAVDRLSETLALEEADSGLRVHALAPGIVDTAMQALIRSAPVEVFPMKEKFIEFKQTDAFNSLGFVAEHITSLAFDADYPHAEVVVRVPSEKD
ncbi:MAG: NAD(P)-dependent dehydrogenase (short-subunit alcohol dehydrogenase family) [Myxococcota bacterium]|jgi:NAD(P)-dependent dehydrogenase (short-subunit alcohol dehydrogenase family)